jgi:hypothetical protein
LFFATQFWKLLVFADFGRSLFGKDLNFAFSADDESRFAKTAKKKIIISFLK